MQSFFTICRQMIPLLIFPFITAILLRYLLPSVHYTLSKSQSLSFYLWAISLTIVMGRTAAFIIDQGSENVREEILIALFSLVACSAQFLLGKVIGQRYNDRIAGGQALGQKNTVLAIWMALTYVHPIASIGPASYVVWQNIINSWQLWKKNKRDRVKAQQEE